MEKLNLVIDDKIPYIREAAALLGDAVYLPGAQISADDVRTADALIVRTRTRIDHTLLEGSRVQFVATATIGFDHIDNRYAREASTSVGLLATCKATKKKNTTTSKWKNKCRARTFLKALADLPLPHLSLHMGRKKFFTFFILLILL